MSLAQNMHLLKRLAAVIVAAHATIAIVRAADAPATVSFSKQIAPVLLAKCQACHGSPEPKGGYQVVN
ncbi:MAG TPA: hypothetical protein VGZ26_02285, partial [Pirellulales bacterium]|nr:hypothetical protein [Pirellulales bacterium]